MIIFRLEQVFIFAIDMCSGVARILVGGAGGGGAGVSTAVGCSHVTV